MLAGPAGPVGNATGSVQTTEKAFVVAATGRGAADEVSRPVHLNRLRGAAQMAMDGGLTLGGTWSLWDTC